MKKIKKERGQISIFIIIAIFIVVIISLIVYLKLFNSPSEINNLSPDISGVYDFVRNCIIYAGKDASETVGLSGGENNDSLKTDSGITYYIYDGKRTSPSHKDIEKEMDSLVKFYAESCTSDFSSFPDLKIDKGNMVPKTKINQNNVIIDVEFPITINKVKKNYYIKDFKDIAIPIRLGYIINTSQEIVDEQLLSPDSMCLSCLYKKSKESGLIISEHLIDLDKSIIIIADNKSRTNQDNYAFAFAIKLKEK